MVRLQYMRLGVSTRMGIVKDPSFRYERLLPLLEGSRIDDVEMDPSIEANEMGWIKGFFKSSRLRLWSLHGLAGHEPLSSLFGEARDEAMENARRTIEVAGYLGAHAVVLHASDEPIAENERAERMAQAKISLASLVPAARQANTVIAVELLPRTCLGNTLEELIDLIEGLPKDRVGACLDVNHVRDVATIQKIIRELDGRLTTIHISDFDGIDERHWLPGKGIIDWPSVWQSLEGIGYDGPWLYESSAIYDDPEANVRAIEGNFWHWLSLVSRDKRRYG